MGHDILGAALQQLHCSMVLLHHLCFSAMASSFPGYAAAAASYEHHFFTTFMYTFWLWSVYQYHLRMPYLNDCHYNVA